MIDRRPARASVLIALWALLLASMLAVVAPAAAQELDANQAKAQVADWSRLLDRAGREIATLRLGEADLQRVTEQADGIKSGAAGLKEAAQGQAGETRDLLESMGAVAPGAAESADAAAQRKELQDRLAHLEGWERQAELIIARTDQLIDRVAAKRLELFAQTLVKRGPSPLNPLTWLGSLRELADLGAVIGASLATWTARPLDGESGVGSALLVLLVAALAGLGVGLVLRRALLRRSGADNLLRDLDRLRAAGIRFVAAASPAAAIALAAWAAWPARELLPNAVVMAVLAGLAVGAAVLLACLWGIAAALAPSAPQRRALSIADAEAATLARRLTAVAWLLAVQIAVDRATTALTVVDSFSAVWSFAMAIALAVAVIRLLERRLWSWSLPAAASASVAGEGAPQTARGDLTWQGLRYLALAALWSAPLIAGLGYANLAEYVYVGVVETGLVLIAAAAAKLLLRALAEAAFDPERGFGRSVAQSFAIDTQGLRLAQFWIGLAADFLIMGVAAVALLIAWGASREDILVLGARLVEGVRIGPVTISITDVLLAMLVFTVALGATRYVQRILDQRIFPGTQLDVGVRNSLRTSVGYAGLVIAAGLAISTLGLNLSSLAIVAGALSVGIGFGLQNIVNNFVSGLILLVERPIKTGDWIVVGDASGIVKRINVRSTEIETQNRSTVLIPNSQLLSSSVVNWTHKDVSGRIDIPVNVAHVSDAGLVRDVLLQCAAANPGVMKAPAPSVLLKDFNGNAFQYELQVCVPRATAMASTASELRFAIDQAFRAKGIGIATK